jgi:hypothetical protein
MTSRQRFERWASRQHLPVTRTQEITRDGPRWLYAREVTEIAWRAWEAQRRHFKAQAKSVSAGEKP